MATGKRILSVPGVEDIIMIGNQPFPNIVVASTSQERVDDLKKYTDIREDDVYIATYPKSGTHWAMDIVAKVQLGGDLEKARKWPRPFLEYGPGPYYNDGDHIMCASLKEVCDLQSPRVIATHMHYENLPPAIREAGAKIIYVWRNYKDILASGFRMHSKYEPSFTLETYFETTAEILREEAIPLFGPWWSHIRSYKAVAGLPNILVLCYDEMKKDGLATVKKVASFLGKDLPEDTLQAITDSINIATAKLENPDSIFIDKGQVGAWKSVLNDTFAKMVDEKLKSENMSEIKF